MEDKNAQLYIDGTDIRKDVAIVAAAAGIFVSAVVWTLGGIVMRKTFEQTIIIAS